MAQTQTQELLKTLGAIEANLNSLTKQFIRERDSAGIHRDKLHQTLNEFGSRLQDVERTSRENKESIKHIAPFASKISQWEQRGIGALAAAAFVGGLLVSAVTAFWNQLKVFFHIMP